jgi:hypothetical protein
VLGKLRNKRVKLKFVYFSIIKIRKEIKIKKVKVMKMIKEINIDKWGKDDWYIFPTFCYNKEWNILTFHFLKFTFEICF